MRNRPLCKECGRLQQAHHHATALSRADEFLQSSGQTFDELWGGVVGFRAVKKICKYCRIHRPPMGVSTEYREKSRSGHLVERVHHSRKITDEVPTDVLVVLVSNDAPLQVAGPREDRMQTQRPFLRLVCRSCLQRPETNHSWQLAPRGDLQQVSKDARPCVATRPLKRNLRKHTRP